MVHRSFSRDHASSQPPLLTPLSPLGSTIHGYAPGYPYAVHVKKRNLPESIFKGWLASQRNWEYCLLAVVWWPPLPFASTSFHCNSNNGFFRRRQTDAQMALSPTPHVPLAFDVSSQSLVVEHEMVWCFSRATREIQSHLLPSVL